jgi:hypothetical protein
VTTSAFIDALAPRRGSLRLVVLRAFTLVGCCLPGTMLVESAARDLLGSDPRTASLTGPLPLHVVQEIAGAIVGAPLAVLAAGVLAFLACDQVLTAGALTLLDPNRRDAHPRVWRMLFDEAAVHFWPLVRVALVTLVFFAICMGALSLVTDALAVRAERHGWTADARYIVVTQWRVAITAIVLAKLGALAFWCKVMTVADGRRRVRRTVIDAVKVLWRAPVRAMAFFVVVTLAAQTATGALLTSVITHGGATGAIVGFSLLIVVHMCLWHVLMHYGRIFYGDARFDDMRGRGDEPLGVWAWVKRKARR